MIFFDDDWIRTADLWWQKQQLSHKHLPIRLHSFTLGPTQPF